MAVSDLQNMTCSGLGAATAVVFTNPAEVVKNRLQMDAELAKSPSARKYRGLLHCFRETARNEGFWGVQKGLGLSIFRDGSKCFFRIGLFDPIIARMHLEKTKPPLWKQLMAGSLSGAAAAIICNPLDLCKVRIQSAGGLVASHHNIEKLSTFGVFKAVAQDEGLLGFWKGVRINMLRSVAFSSTLMTANSRVKGFLKNKLGTVGLPADVISSLCGSMIGIIFLNPIDIVRTRIFNQPAGAARLYKNGFDAAFKILKHEGAGAFFKGIGPNFLRIGPHTVLTFVFIGQYRKLFEGKRS